MKRKIISFGLKKIIYNLKNVNPCPINFRKPIIEKPIMSKFYSVPFEKKQKIKLFINNYQTHLKNYLVYHKCEMRDCLHTVLKSLLTV